MSSILVIENTDAVLVRVCEILRQAGHEVAGATSGARGLEVARVRPFDLVITDMYMPAVDGFDVIRGLRSLPWRVPFVAMSANPFSLDVLGPAQTMGAAATLGKPFTVSQVLEAVVKVLHARADLSPA